MDLFTSEGVELPVSSFTAGGSSVPNTFLPNVANARKQYFAGVQNEKSTGRTCAVSTGGSLSK